MRTVIAWTDEEYDNIAAVEVQLKNKGLNYRTRYEGVYLIELTLNKELAELLGVDVGPLT